MNILNKIISHKKNEIKILKSIVQLMICNQQDYLKSV